MADVYTTSNIRTNISASILMRNFVISVLILTTFLVTSCGTTHTDVDQEKAKSNEVYKSMENAPKADPNPKGNFSIEPDTLNPDSFEAIESTPDEFGESGWDDEYDDTDIPVEYGDDIEWTEEMDDEGGEESMLIDSYLDDDVIISKEKMIFSGVIRVIRPDFRDDRDSVLAEIEKKLVISPERVPRTIIVEKWISPVNYRGYKFNRKKLMIYGVEKDRQVTVFYYLETFYVAMDTRVYELIETAAHAPFEQVSDADLVRHLLAHESSL